MKINRVISGIFLLSFVTCFRVDTANVAAWSNDRIEDIFTDIYKTNHWESRETVSGPGSTLRVTQRMRQELSALIRRFGVTSIADAPH